MRDAVALKALVVAGLITTAVLACSGGLRPVLDGPDSTQYVALSNCSPMEILGSCRTLGYPMLLRLVRSITPGLSLIPFIQLGALLAAAGAWFYGLRATGTPVTIATVAALRLLASPLLTHVMAVRTDALGCALSVASVGAALAFLGTGRTAALVATSLLAFCAYQIRPAYLFLIPFLPVLGATLGSVLDRAEPARRAIRATLALAAATAIPYMTFAVIRFALVGHFGLVSFAGTNLIGIAGQFAAPGATPPLPQPCDSLVAAVVVAQRDSFRELEATGRALDTLGIIAPGVELDPVARMRNRAYIDYAYVRTISLYAASAARIVGSEVGQTSVPVRQDDRLGDGHAQINQIAVDRLLLRTAIELIRRNPVLYATYVAKNLRVGLLKAVAVHDEALAAVLILLLASVVGVPAWLQLSLEDYGRALRVLLPSCIGYALASGLLVVAVEPAIDRYTDAMGVLCPSLYGLALVGAAQVLSHARTNTVCC